MYYTINLSLDRFDFKELFNNRLEISEFLKNFKTRWNSINCTQIINIKILHSEYSDRFNILIDFRSSWESSQLKVSPDFVKRQFAEFYKDYKFSNIPEASLDWDNLLEGLNWNHIDDKWFLKCEYSTPLYIDKNGKLKYRPSALDELYRVTYGKTKDGLQKTFLINNITGGCEASVTQEPNTKNNLELAVLYLLLKSKGIYGKEINALIQQASSNQVKKKKARRKKK